MEAPRRGWFLWRVTHDALHSMIGGLTSRRGLRPLLRLMGFSASLQPVHRAAAVERHARRTWRTRNGLLSAWVTELHGTVDAGVLRDIARSLRAADAVSHHVIVATEPGYDRVAIACDALGDRLRHVVLEPRHVRAGDMELLQELACVAGEDDTAAALRLTRVLDRGRLSERFFRDIAAMRNLVSRGWTGLPQESTGPRDGLALLLLSRLIFLYFLQRQGLLAGRPHFLWEAFDTWRARRRRMSFFRGPLRLLFFGVLNRRPERRTGAALALGPMPYLNGGLFEVHALESASGDVDLPDDVIARVFHDVLEKYRFTAPDGGPHHEVLGVDPEMLGRIFEGLMPGERRARTGTFYTPSRVVDGFVRRTLASHLARRCDVAPTAVLDLFDGRQAHLSAADAGRIRTKLRHIALVGGDAPRLDLRPRRHSMAPAPAAPGAAAAALRSDREWERADLLRTAYLRAAAEHSTSNGWADPAGACYPCARITWSEPRHGALCCVETRAGNSLLVLLRRGCRQPQLNPDVDALLLEVLRACPPPEPHDPTWVRRAARIAVAAAASPHLMMTAAPSQAARASSRSATTRAAATVRRWLRSRGASASTNDAATAHHILAMLAWDTPAAAEQRIAACLRTGPLDEQVRRLAALARDKRDRPGNCPDRPGDRRDGRRQAGHPARRTHPRRPGTGAGPLRRPRRGLAEGGARQPPPHPRMSAADPASPG